MTVHRYLSLLAIGAIGLSSIPLAIAEDTATGTGTSVEDSASTGSSTNETDTTTDETNTSTDETTSTETTTTTTTETSTSTAGVCAEFTGARKAHCERKQKMKQAKEECGGIQDPAEKKACRDAVLGGKPGVRKMVRRRVGHELKENCAGLRGHEKRDCMRRTLGQIKEKHPGIRRVIRHGLSEDAKAELKACKELPVGERADCVRAVKQKYGNATTSDEGTTSTQ